MKHSLLKKPHHTKDRESNDDDGVTTSAVKNVTAKSEFPVVSPILQILPVTGQIF